MQHQPALGDRMVEPGLVLRGRALELEQKRPVDLLNIDPAVLDGLDALASSTSLRAAASGSAKGRRATNFIVA